MGREVQLDRGPPHSGTAGGNDDDDPEPPPRHYHQPWVVGVMPPGPPSSIQVLVNLFLFLFVFYFLKILYLFIFERGEGREKEGEKHHCVVASHVAPTGDPACSPGMCPDWESNQRLFGLQPVVNPLSYTSQG